MVIDVHMPPLSGGNGSSAVHAHALSTRKPSLCKKGRFQLNGDVRDAESTVLPKFLR